MHFTVGVSCKEVRSCFFKYVGSQRLANSNKETYLDFQFPIGTEECCKPRSLYPIVQAIDYRNSVCFSWELL